MSNNTPGPWVVGLYGRTEIVAEDPQRSIALVAYHDDPEEHQANVNLIMAAPELLAACEAEEEAEQLYESLPSPMRADYDMLKYEYEVKRQWASRTRKSAIAKAKGEMT